jgi:predicted signal transduction protein with EAL and GGDEF domain
MTIFVLLPGLVVAAVVLGGIILFFISSVRPVWKILAAAVIALVVAAVVAAVFTTRTGDLIRGIARIEVVNRSARPLADLELGLHHNGKEWTETRPTLAPGEFWRLQARTPDLYLGRLSFTLDGRRVTCDDGGIACNGERLVISIGDNGTVSQTYAP